MILRDLIVKSAGYLERQIISTGQFVYQVDFDPFATLKPSYNLLRHAGTLYSMCQAHQYGVQLNPYDLDKVGMFLIDQCIPSPKGGLAVYEDPELVFNIQKDTQYHVKLGGAALAVCALTQLKSIVARPEYEDTLKGLTTFIETMQRPNGSFYSKYDIEKDKYLNWHSLYYPGQAILALYYMFENTGDERLFEIGLKGLMYLAESRNTSNEIIPPDHWALIATGKYLAADTLTEYEKELLVWHASSILSVFKTEQQIDGGYNINGALTPTSTRLEGMVAVHKYVENMPNLFEDIHKGLELVTSNIILDGRYNGAIPDSTRGSLIRIDYVQHALSAMINYEKELGIGFLVDSSGAEDCGCSKK